MNKIQLKMFGRLIKTIEKLPRAQWDFGTVFERNCKLGVNKCGAVTRMLLSQLG